MEVSLIKHTYLPFHLFENNTYEKKVYLSEQESSDVIKTQNDREITNVISLLISLKTKPPTRQLSKIRCTNYLY
jgi:hypothetical protein